MTTNSLKLDLLERILSEPCERKIAEAALEAFKGLVAGDYYSVLYCHLPSRTIDSFQPGAGWLGSAHPLMQTVKEKFSHHPLTRKFLQHRQPAAYLRSDLVPDRLWQRGEIYNEVDRPLGIEDMTALYQTTPSGHLMILNCGRSRKFQAPEIKPVQTFQRVLSALPSLCLAAPLPASPAPSGLSFREHEILHWVKQGKRNSEIAVILGISHHTVRHHLEKVFAKTGVETRTAAARALEP